MNADATIITHLNSARECQQSIIYSKIPPKKCVMSLHVHSFERIGVHIVDLNLEWNQSFTLNTLESTCILSETYIDRLRRT